MRRIEFCVLLIRADDAATPRGFRVWSVVVDKVVFTLISKEHLVELEKGA